MGVRPRNVPPARVVVPELKEDGPKPSSIGASTVVRIALAPRLLLAKKSRELIVIRPFALLCSFVSVFTCAWQAGWQAGRQQNEEETHPQTTVGRTSLYPELAAGE